MNTSPDPTPGITQTRKFTWARKHWASAETEAAEQHLKVAVRLIFVQYEIAESSSILERKDMRREAARSDVSGGREPAVKSSSSARAQGGGLSGLEGWFAEASSNASPIAHEAQDFEDVLKEFEQWVKRGIIENRNQRANPDLVRSLNTDVFRRAKSLAEHDGDMTIAPLPHEERMSFTVGLLVREELETIEIEPTLYYELLTTGRYDELVLLLQTADTK
ncbi:uncharacterized protein SCHCODRAFT_01170393 [Schizophyllum commune H4-8]|nr:uncharacterized protein SCHCODRAFT_01170393 [Schizophyllum commune H4-8]KAI5896203.1 hypothetical protein SCHCODRAFT_01170393 [Schizophyllum commune H4-8]